jgi:hypothetical protein
MAISDRARLQALHERWSPANTRERSNAQLYIVELCDALGVERPRPAGTGYEFEYPVRVVGREDGAESCNYVDLHKNGCFVLEAKQHGRERTNDMLLRKAFGQVHAYAKSLPGTPPPYLLVLDVGRTLIVWDRWQGTYGSFAAGRRIDLTDLAYREDDVRLLQDIWEDPSRRNPGLRAAEVTEEIARKLAELARRLEEQRNDPERVARFMMRCVFTMFAEDTGLLPERFFQRAIQAGLRDPGGFVNDVEALWRAMDRGRRFYFQPLLRFNGHFFHDAEVLPLGTDDLALLLRASQAAWRQVEPAIFGTLLTRALDRAERHRLGAEYTPRAYVERVIRSTIEEPVREWWTCVQAEVLELRDRAGKSARQQRRDTSAAIERVREFHGRLRSLRVLDPACGSGNFLYVALHTLKRIEREVLLTIEQLTGQHDLGMESVGPWQFHGIEIKPWAREIAELTLWIGYHQVWTEYHPGTQPPEPVLRATGTLDHRDAILVWDDIVEDPNRSRPDPTPRLPHRVTGRLVPDPAARLRYEHHSRARPAEWPQADFIVGNPPYMGQARQREAFGDGYVDALRDSYPGVPDTADYVTYWWHRAAEEVASGRTVRAGLITTNSITQAQNRVVIDSAAQQGVRITWAVADHPWVDESGAADVRVAMTVLAKNPGSATLVRVDDQAMPVGEITVDRLNADLTAHADVATASSLPLRANAGLASPGFKLHGSGFILPPAEGRPLAAVDPRHSAVVRPFLNGRDLASRPRGVYVVDFGLRSEREARTYPVLFDIVRSRVKPERDANARATYSRFWWRFGESRRDLRDAIAGLPRYIATPETAKHRYFVFLEAEVAPDNSLVCIASADPFHLGVLSSSIHGAWALAAGSRLGIGNDPRYNKTRCFDPFPFPDPPNLLRHRIADIAEMLDRHRRDALLRDDGMTTTAIYNVLEKLRAGRSLDLGEKHVHDAAACGVLLDLHDELDAAVAEAYGWSSPMGTEEMLEHLVALHHERRIEEAAESVRWLRPEFQVAGSLFAPQKAPMRPAAPSEETYGPLRWPDKAVEQIAALLGLFVTGPLSVETAGGWFENPDMVLIKRHLNTLVLMGEVQRDQDGLCRRGVFAQPSRRSAVRPHLVQPPWSMVNGRRGTLSRRNTAPRS